MKTLPTDSEIRTWMGNNYKDCFNENNEVNITLLGESCADHFECITDDGNSEIEDLIFEIASEFYSYYR